MMIKTTASVLNAVPGVKYFVSALKKKAYKIAMICDDELFASLEFIYACKKEEIKPIVAQEKIVEGVKLLLIAKNHEGFKNLSRLSGLREPSLEEIKPFMGNIIPVIAYDNLDKDQMIKAKMILEIEYAGIRKGSTIDERIKEALINSLNLKNIPYEIAKFINKEDYRLLNYLKAMKEKALYENIAIEEDERNAYLKSKDFWNNVYPEETKNLGEILKSCENDYKFGNPVPPNYTFCKEAAIKYGLDENISQKDLFAELSRRGLEDRLKLVPVEQHQEYRDRLEFEINVIQKMNFDGYLLIVWDFTNAAKEMFIPVGPGRGSAAGSLVAFSLKITNLDPIPYGLLFERFLNPERVSMPDIDMDFCQTRRLEIMEYVSNKYGEKNVAQIITFGKMKARSGIKDTGRVLSYGLADKLAGLIPDDVNITLKDAYEQVKEDIDKLCEDPHGRKVWEVSNKLENSIKNLGVHAAGLVISDEDITERCPKCFVGDTQVVQFEGKYLEDVNLIKFDFLGLKTLSVVDECLKMIKQNHNIDIDLDTMKLTDPAVFKFISTGTTKGMFQIESDGMQVLCKRLQPDCFEDLIAILALYRPGPMESGMLDDFIERKRGRQEINYFFDEMTEALEPILKPTYGVIVYQEQVMQIVQTIGGFSLGGADLVRRAMGKKIKEELDKLKGQFSDGAVEKGFKRENAEELFDLIIKFAGYGFNKSHSAAYALITYYTAFLKTYYPAEFMTSLMNFDYGKHDKLIPMLKEAEALGIEISKPNINTSGPLFTTDGKRIIFGLKAIKGVGVDVEKLLELRNNVGEFKDLKDFLYQTRIIQPTGKKILDGLAYSGALDEIASRGFFKENMVEITKIKTIKNFENKIEAIMSTTPEDLKTSEKVELEKDFLGYILSNPFEEEKSLINNYIIETYQDLIAGSNKIIGWVSEVSKVKKSKKGSKFAILKVLDLNYEERELLLFEKRLGELEKDLKKPVILDISTKDGGAIFLNEIIELNAKTINNLFPQRKEPVQEAVEIEIGDYASLLKENKEVKIIKIKDNEELIFSFNL